MSRMTSPKRLILFAAAPALTLAVLAVQGVAHEPVTDTPVQCEFNKRTYGGMTELTSRVTSSHAVSGTFELRIEQSAYGNSAVIQQSGDFVLPAHGSEDLGETVIPSDGHYDIELKLNVGGERMTCRTGSEGAEI